MSTVGDLPPVEEAPAAHLEGRDLGNGWVVGQRATRDPGATGGTFSISYTVTHRDGRKGFLKALNFPAASVGPARLRIVSTDSHQLIFSNVTFFLTVAIAIYLVWCECSIMGRYELMVLVSLGMFLI